MRISKSKVPPSTKRQQKIKKRKIEKSERKKKETERKKERDREKERKRQRERKKETERKKERMKEETEKAEPQSTNTVTIFSQIFDNSVEHIQQEHFNIKQVCFERKL